MDVGICNHHLKYLNGLSDLVIHDKNNPPILCGHYPKIKPPSSEAVILLTKKKKKLILHLQHPLQVGIFQEMPDFQEATPASSSKRRRKEFIKSPGNPVDDTVFFHRTKLTTLFKINKDLTPNQRRDLDKVVFVGHVARSFLFVGKQLHTRSLFLEQWSHQEISRAIDVFKHMGSLDANFIWKVNEQLGGLKMDESVSKESVQRDSTTDPIVRDDLSEHLTLINQGVSGIISLLKCNRDTPANCGQDDNKMGTEIGKDPMTGQKVASENGKDPMTGQKIASDNGKDKMTGQNVACENGKNRMTGQKGASEESFDETMKPTKLDFDVCSSDTCTPARSCNTGKDIFQYFKEITIMDTNASEYVFNRDGDVSKFLVKYEAWSVTRAEMLTIEYPHWLLSPVIDMVALHVTLNRIEEYSSKRNWGMALSLHSDASIQKRFFRDRVFNGRADECLSITLTISDGNIHWYMCIVDMKRSVILIRDTLRSEVTNKSRIELPKKVIMQLEGIISTWDGDGFIHENIANTYDCGLYVCIKLLCHSTPSANLIWRQLTEESMEARKRVADTLYTAKYNQITRGAMAGFFVTSRGGNEVSNDQTYDSCTVTMDTLYGLLCLPEIHRPKMLRLFTMVVNLIATIHLMTFRLRQVMNYEIMYRVTYPLVQGYKECYCRQLAVIRTSWTSENPIRRFSSCELYKPIPPMIWSTVEPLLPIECTLQNSEGDDAFKWPVVIKRLGTKIGFADGWEDFLRENSIKANDILLFELGGTNRFIVYHFDLSCARRALRSVVGSCIQDDEELDGMEEEAIVGGFHIQASFTLVSRGRQDPNLSKLSTGSNLELPVRTSITSQRNLDNSICNHRIKGIGDGDDLRWRIGMKNDEQTI
ncbi:B3 domain-containing protein [Striga asiatica]|uniref:B3 domain-containing protein n=1 Tax=Striga asiatica TaxID=4170 RepID=A0A5A7P7T9_STRAF|nr:B3 domain-containing protein [Striga asiatica]